MANLVSPIQVILNNIDQQPILFIPDGPQQLLLEVTNLSGQKLQLGRQNFFRLVFRPSTLVRAVSLNPSGVGLIAPLPQQDRGIQLVNTDTLSPADSDLRAAADESAHWQIEVKAGDDGSVMVTVNPKADETRTLDPLDPLKPETARTSRLVLRFSNVQPTAAGQGTRSTPVDIQFKVTAVTVTNVAGAGAASPGPVTTLTDLNGIEKAHLTLLNISRTAYLAEERSSAITNARVIPFAAEFIGSNNVFNDGQPSVLRLRVKNVNDAPLNLSRGLSRIRLTFFTDGDDPPSPPLPPPAPPNLPSPADIANGLASPPGPILGAPPVIPPAAPDHTIGALAETRSLVTIEPFDPRGVKDPWSWNGSEATATLGDHWDKGGEFQIQINIPATRRPSGYAPLRLEFSDLPDHPDGKLELLAQVGPLFVDNEVAVGITRPLRFYGNENSTKVNTVPPPGTIGISSTGELNIDAPHNLRINGRLAAPRLRDGVLVAEDTLDRNPPAAGNVTVQHTVTAETFRTATGFNLELPAGTILMWSPPPEASATITDPDGSTVATDAPEGWVICDGRPIFASDPNGRRTPDLRGRFLVGQGTYKEPDPALDDPDRTLTLTYSLQNNGGVARVALKEAEAPGHTHSFLGNVVPAGFEEGNVKFAHAFPDHGASTIGTFTANLSSNLGGPTLDEGIAGGPALGHENRPPFFVVVYIMKIK